MGIVTRIRFGKPSSAPLQFTRFRRGTTVVRDVELPHAGGGHNAVSLLVSGLLLGDRGGRGPGSVVRGWRRAWRAGRVALGCGPAPSSVTSAVPR